MPATHGSAKFLLEAFHSRSRDNVRTEQREQNHVSPIRANVEDHPGVRSTGEKPSVVVVRLFANGPIRDDQGAAEQLDANEPRAQTRKAPEDARNSTERVTQKAPPIEQRATISPMSR